MAEWLPDGLWRLILNCSGLWWQSRSQIASGGSFGALLRTGCGIALRWPIEVHFELILSSADRMAPRWPLEPHFALQITIPVLEQTTVPIPVLEQMGVPIPFQFYRDAPEP